MRKSQHIVKIFPWFYTKSI